MLIYVISICDELKQQGFLKGGRYQLGPAAHKGIHKDMEAGGFVATDDDIHAVMEFL